MIYVSLISYTPDPERTNAAAIRISTSPVSATAITMKTMAETTFQPLNIWIDNTRFTPHVHGGSRVKTANRE